MRVVLGLCTQGNAVSAEKMIFRERLPCHFLLKQYPFFRNSVFIYIITLCISRDHLRPFCNDGTILLQP